MSEPATPTQHKHSMTNGAAHVAFACLVNGLEDTADIWTAGQLRAKLKAAKNIPSPTAEEKKALPTGEELILSAYKERIEAWMDASFGEVTMEEDEREVLKSAMTNLSSKGRLPKGEFIDATMELIGLMGLNKKR